MTYTLSAVLAVTPYGLPACYEYVRETCCIHLQGRNKRIISSLTQNTSIHYFSSCFVAYSSHTMKLLITVLDRPMFSTLCIKSQQIPHTNPVWEKRYSSIGDLYNVGIAVLTLDAELLARSQYPEGPASGHLDKGFPWFPCVYKRMLRWFPSFQVATTGFSCSPPDLNFLDTFFSHLCPC